MVKILVAIAVWIALAAIVAVLFGRAVPKDRPGPPFGRRGK